MTVCNQCGGSNIEADPASGASICVACGNVLEENTIVSEVTFSETATGASVLQGQFISAATGSKPLSTGSNFGGLSRESREVTLKNGRTKIQAVATALRLNSHQVEAAQRLFQVAMQHNFIQGRRTQNVVAACLYIVCRREHTPHMLIDFSDVLQTNVFVLGDTFMKFCRLLNFRLPIVDPSLYIHRFAARLEFGDKTHLVAMTALRLVSRMKRDWMQVGRRPSGICGAGLLIASRLHGFRRTQREIIQVVKVCDMTLRKRLLEFEDTPSGKLTPQEFETIDLEEEADPPSFAQARKRARAAATASVAQLTDPNAANNPSLLQELEATGREMDQEFQQMDNDALTADGTGSAGGASKAARPKEIVNLSDLDDDEEIRNVLLTEEEVQAKSALWMEANKDYLEQQEEKKRTLGESGMAKAEARKKRRKQRAEARQAEPTVTATEAARQVLAQRKISKKINYAVLEGLFPAEADLPAHDAALKRE